MDNDVKEALTRLNATLNSAQVSDFVHELEENGLELMIKKVDKKREKNILAEHRAGLILQLSECSDPVLGLHLAVLIVFQTIQETMLHASGKFAPQILQFIDKDLSPELREKFRKSQDQVLKFVSSKDESEEKAAILGELTSLFEEYREIVISKDCQRTISMYK